LSLIEVATIYTFKVSNKGVVLRNRKKQHFGVDMVNPVGHNMLIRWGEKTTTELMYTFTNTYYRTENYAVLREQFMRVA
jgi:hypothetical protein